MNQDRLKELLEGLKELGLEPSDAEALLRSHMTPDLGFARVDAGRGNRASLPEVILAEGKRVNEVVAITEELLARAGLAVVSRAGEEVARALADAIPSGEYHSRASMFVAGEFRGGTDEGEGSVSVVSAGTSDIHAAEEAAVLLETMKVKVARFYDIGVAGVHRLAMEMPGIRKGRVCLVFAGMDAALPTVLGGLFPGPLVAVPTSTGYGTAFGGVAALLSMLNSCSPGITVMNIDNGLGAAAAALRIIRGDS